MTRNGDPHVEPLTGTRIPRDRNRQAKALESLLYEMVMLESALLLRDKRYFFEFYPRLLWGPPQIAHDVIRLKSRLLLDFFYPTSPRPNDMIAADFGTDILARLDPGIVRRLRAFKAKVNRWTVHLTWTRTSEPEYSKTDRKMMEQHALQLLDLGDQFIRRCLDQGIELVGWAVHFYAAFTSLHTHLKETPRVEEGTGRRPADEKLISLTQLGL